MGPWLKIPNEQILKVASINKFRRSVEMPFRIVSMISSDAKKQYENVSQECAALQNDLPDTVFPNLLIVSGCERERETHRHIN